MYRTLEDAKVLFAHSRLDGAFYICGYVVELGLKVSICKTLGWEGYPESKREFEGLTSFKTHDLEMLLHLSGCEKSIKENYFAEWSVVTNWDTEIRYSSEKRNSEQVELMLKASEKLLDIL